MSDKEKSPNSTGSPANVGGAASPTSDPPPISLSGSQLPSTPSHSYATRPVDLAEQIKTLHEVHQQGGLTVEEFAQAKQQVLASSSYSSTKSNASTHSKESARVKRRRRHRRRRSSTPTSAARSRTSRTKGTASSKSTRRRRSKRSSSSSSTSSSSSSSGSGSSSRFIIIPRTNVWRTLHAVTPSLTSRADTPVGENYTSDSAPHSPLYVPKIAVQPGEVGSSLFDSVVNGPLVDGALDTDNETTALLVRESDKVGAFAPADAAEAAGPSAVASADALKAAPTSAPAGGRARARSDNDPTRADLRERILKYGTFFQTTSAGAVPADVLGDAIGAAGRGHARLEPDDEVHVRYFNSRGASGDRFADVQLKEEELREPFFLHKGVASVSSHNQYAPTAARAAARAAVPAAAVPGLPGAADTGHVLFPPAKEGALPGDFAVAHVVELEPGEHLTKEEAKAWAEMTSSSRSHSSSRTNSSYVEQSLNWYWIDVTGRDPSRRRYNSALNFLTKKFNICESFLVDREHILVLPQICESPHYPGQYLINLRVATHKISISDDSVIELTNRWILIVDLRQHFVITLHRVDTHSMAQLRSQWKKIMGQNEVSFQEFLLKIIDDAIQTYELSLDVHADLLDRCESKLFANENPLTKPAQTKVKQTAHMVDLRIMHHFAGSSRSPFLQKLLDIGNKAPMNKMEMNSFLHHLHRRTSVQHRMLNATQVVLPRAFTKLKLCSKEMAEQLCSSCMELSGRALEVRDDAKTLLDLHISLQSFRTNELMALLTRVSIFFTPCTFLAGVYGMNFTYMPELDFRYGYPAFWVVCIVLVIFMQKFGFS